MLKGSFSKVLKFGFTSLQKSSFYCAISFADFNFLQTVQKCWTVLKTLILRKTMVIFEFFTLKLVYNSKWTFSKIFFINLIGLSSYFWFITFYLRFYVQKTSFNKNTEIINIHKDITHLFCLKRFFFEHCFLYVNANTVDCNKSKKFAICYVLFVFT